MAEDSAVQNLEDAFAGAADGQQPLQQPVDIEVAGRIAFGLWLRTVGPLRAVQRPESFFDKVVNTLWDADIFTPEDLAHCFNPAHIGGGTPGIRQFIKDAWKAAGGKPADPGRPPAAHGAAASSDPYSSEALDDRLLKMQVAMFQQLQTSKPVEVPPTFDLEAAIIEIGLAGLSEDCMPCSEVVEKLHAATEKLRKTKKVPFVSAKLAAFLPAHARAVGFKDDEVDDDSETLRTMQKVMGIKKEKKNLSFLQCMQALDTYIVAEAVTKQFEFTAGLAHIAIVKQVAGRAVEDGERHGVATVYDELVREKWVNKAHTAGMRGTFDLNAAMRELDEKVYLKALNAAKPYKAVAVEAPPAESSRVAGRSRDGKCNYCGKQGHFKFECLQYKADQSSGGTEKLPAAVQDDAAGDRKRPRHH